MEACCLDTDVAALADGHSTVIGDRGVTLSSGQRQRISLARAVYSDRDVYLLDDPLATVDPDVALTIFRRVVLDLLVGKTVLLVTHQMQVTAAALGCGSGRTCNQQVARSTRGRRAFRHRPCSRTFAFVTRQYNLVPAKGR